jgi:tetratricopeptide (TPR) repeat protein
MHNSRIEELRRRVQLDPASIAFAALAEEYRRAGRFEDAIAACEAGLQRHPAYISARVTLGRSLLELGRFDEARHQLEHVLRTAPENLAAIRALAEIHDRVGDYANAQYGAGPAADSQPVTPPTAVRTAPSPAPTPVASPAPAAPAPVEPVQMAPPPLQVPAGPPPPVVRPPVHVGPAPQAPPAAPPRVPHPDEAALPALEAFLAAIRAAKAAGRQPFD